MSHRPPRTSRRLPGMVTLATALAACAWLAGCGGAKTASDETLIVEGDVPLAYVQRATTIRIDPTGGAPFAAGGDLLVREKSSPSAPEINLTHRFTDGKGDASDPEVSYDGKKIVFAMRCPASNTATTTVDGATVPACTGRWNIWEYDMTTGGVSGGTFRRLTASTQDDDVDPAYLPAGRGFVFSSNRQAKSHLDQALGQSYYALDEYERERVLNLHTMDAEGANIAQITFNQSHDRNPVVRPNGDIMFARWEHVADRNRFAVFRVKPDGTDMFVLYGAQSSGNSFLHPRDMDPNGTYKGFIASSLMPLQRTQEGGALMFIDAANYSEQNTPANAQVAAVGGQAQGTEVEITLGRDLSLYGRYTTPYPLWDGTNRVLVAYRPCEVTKNDAITPCLSLTTEELASLQENDEMTVAERNSAAIRDDAPAAYAIYMYDPVKKDRKLVAAPPDGFMFTDPIPLQARDEPNATEATPLDATLAGQNMGLIEVRSIYDTDGLMRMAETMLVASDLPAGCERGIAQTTPPDSLDTRAAVADIVRLKTPGDAAYGCSPVRWVRALRAIPPPASMMGTRSAIGETDFEQQQILGYAQLEPDGSFKLEVPADIPLALQVIDAKGRAIQTHTNWIQVRPGERRTCDGCHSPRRGAALNSGTIVNTVPDTLRATLASAHQPGETMAALRTRLDATLLRLSSDMTFSDVWADTAKAGVTARADISLRYTGNPDPADDLATAVPVNGVINYPEHVQPIWTRSRGPGGAHTCTLCHADPAVLDLSGTVAGSGRLQSYEELMVGDPIIDEATGLPRTRLQDGVPMIERGPALVETSSGATNTAGQARKSRLTEILFGETLLAGASARTAHPTPPATAPDHATLLNKAEKRVVSEWMDLGGQYYNNPFTATGVRSITGLSQTTFETTVFPLLRSTCAAGCHQAIGSDETTPTGASFRENRFVLTGEVEGDYGSTVSMISDICNAANNALLRRPSTAPHPAGAVTQTTPPLPVGSSAYNTIAAWITSGCSGQ